jgi:hypothetical protein
MLTRTHNSETLDSANQLMDPTTISEDLLRQVVAGDTAARELVMTTTRDWIVGKAWLPLGPYSNDADLRRDIASKVLGDFFQPPYTRMQKLIEKACAPGARLTLVESYWQLARMRARWRATDLCRKMSLAMRGEDSLWPETVSVDPR